ncbi:unnamed protein product [Blepharisma stoltei]|uniref:Response regulatory domain-containing protein n=1 Tax=Blepharisma stoltei TaxID=1481888 RepID=A0AAU9IBH0_9CILI|nr:unnamed protein product [Blepharisma stoltei]
MVSPAYQNSNLYYHDQSFEQNINLLFKDSCTEKRYSLDISRAHEDSIAYIFGWLILIVLTLLILGDLTFYEAASFISTCLPWFVARNTSPTIQRILLEIPTFMCLSKIIKTGDFFESFAGFSLSFVFTLNLFSHWTNFLFISLIEILFLYLMNSIKLSGLILAVFTFTFIFSVAEKDFRTLWRIYQSIKKSNSTYYSFFQNLHFAVFIVNSSGNIIHLNKNALKMIAKLHPGTNNFMEIFVQDYHDLIELLIKNAILKGCPGKEEFLCKQHGKDIEFNKNDVLGYSIYAESITWKSENCAMLICTDITDSVNNKALQISLTRAAKPALEAFGRSLGSDIDDSHPQSKENFQEFMTIKYFHCTSLIYQSVFFNSIVLSKDSFSIDDDIQNAIEISYGKAQRKGITVTYQKDQGIPKSVIGDQSMHFYILQTIFAFAIDTALPNSEIYLRAEISSAIGKELCLAYTLSIRTRKFENADLRKIFHVKRTEKNRISMEELVENCLQYGFGIALLDSLLAFLSGQISEASMGEIETDKFTLILKIPYSISDKAPKSKLIRITSNQTYETPLTAKWKPLPESWIDECKQLDNQIIKLRSRHKDSYFAKFEIQALSHIEIEPIQRCSTFSSIEVSDFDENSDLFHKIYVYNSNDIVRLVTFDPAKYETNFQAENPRKVFVNNLINRKIKISSPGSKSPLPDYSQTDTVKIHKFIEKDCQKYKLDPQKMKVLVVDDIENQREIIEAIVNKLFGASYDSAKDGNMAVEMFKSYIDQGFLYQIIFMDVYMPITDGLKATQQIRDIEAQKGAPRTFICGMSGDSELRQKCLNAGMDEFLLKPSSPQDLKRIVEMSKGNKI